MAQGHSSAWRSRLSRLGLCRPARSENGRECYHGPVYAQKFRVETLIRGEKRLCPLEWLDQFCMRNFTNSPDFDDTLPLRDGEIEAGFRLSPERFAEGLGAWLTQRGKGQGGPVQVQVTRSTTI